MSKFDKSEIEQFLLALLSLSAYICIEHLDIPASDIVRDSIVVVCRQGHSLAFLVHVGEDDIADQDIVSCPERWDRLWLEQALVIADAVIHMAVDLDCLIIDDIAVDCVVELPEFVLRLIELERLECHVATLIFRNLCF